MEAIFMLDNLVDSSDPDVSCQLKPSSRESGQASLAQL